MKWPHTVVRSLREQLLPTISDVADHAGVSPATVSRVIQGAKNVRPATRAKVERAIQELGYVPSAVAQSLRSKRTRSLALVVSDITNPFWTTIARGVEDGAQRHDYSVLLCNTDEDLAKQLRYLDFLISQQVDGVIIAPYNSDAEHLDKLRRRNIPTVIIDRRIDGWDVDSVSGDSVAGARALVQHLIGLGHERIAIITGPVSTSTAEDRILGYNMALAEAGLPIDQRLIQRGEFRHTSGEELTYRLLDEDLAPTAIFAANNAIAMGVIDAAAKRNLRIPQDIALVAFDDVPSASRLFPFLTVVAQPVYEIGVHATQLLLSRLDSEVSLQPRHVVLPSRLIVRHSCGIGLEKNGSCPLSVPIPGNSLGQSTLVKPLTDEERRDLARWLNGVTARLPDRPDRLAKYGKSDVNRLLKALRYQEPDRVPHLDLWVESKQVYEYVLEREVEYGVASAKIGGQPITPEDHVDFALRLGMDAIGCNFEWRPQHAELYDLEPPPSLTDQISHLERYLRAAQGSGLGVIAHVSSFFDCALRAADVQDVRARLNEDQSLLEQLMDMLLEHQARVMRVVCDRFAEDLALIVIEDHIAGPAGPVLPLDRLAPILEPRMERLIAPVREHGKELMLHTTGCVAEALPLIHDMGFDAVHPLQPECNDTLALKERWSGRLAFGGAISTSLLAQGSRDQIEAEVRDLCIRVAPGGGYVLGASGPVGREIPPANYVAMVRAVHRYGRYGSLGQET